MISMFSAPTKTSSETKDEKLECAGHQGRLCPLQYVDISQQT